MLDFKKLTYEDYSKVKKYFITDNERYRVGDADITCDMVFGTTFFWRGFYNTKYAILGDTLILQITNGGIEMYSSPLGNGDFDNALQAIKEYVHSRGNALYFCFVPEFDLHFFYDNYDIVFSTEEPDWYDYVYDKANLSDFPGRKYHRQKNHCNKYLKTNPNARFITINSENAAKVKEYAAEWHGAFSDTSDMSAAEFTAVADLLDNWDDNPCLGGGFIESDGNIHGFTIGEIVGDTVYVHVEKADHTVNGAYQFLSSEYLRSITDENVIFVNREEDMGIEGLRKSKQSLHPEKLLKKYTLYCC